MSISVCRHDLQRDVVEPSYFQQAFELPSPHHCAPDLSAQRRLFQDEVHRRSRITFEDRLAGQTSGHHAFHVIR
jgi:hypothetical protein